MGARLALAVGAAILLPACNSAGGSSGTAPDAVAPLALSCPSNVRFTDVKTPAQPVTYATPAHSGGVDPASISCSPASGTTFSQGTTTVSCTARDSSSITREAACSFTVTLLPYAPTMSVTRFMAFGDSITKGEINDNMGGCSTPPGPESVPFILPSARQPDFGYPGVVDRLLTAQYGSQSFTVINEGAPNHTATEDLGRFVGAFDQDDPEVVLLLQGILDVFGGISPTAALRQDIGHAEANGAKAVFVSTLLPIAQGFRSCGHTNAEIRDANDDIRAMVASQNATLVDGYQAFVGRLDTLMGPDGLHPSVEGQEVLGQLFFEAIRSRFEVAPTAAPQDRTAASPLPRPDIQVRSPAQR